MYYSHLVAGSEGKYILPQVLYSSVSPFKSVENKCWDPNIEKK